MVQTKDSINIVFVPACVRACVHVCVVVFFLLFDIKLLLDQLKKKKKKTSVDITTNDINVPASYSRSRASEIGFALDKEGKEWVGGWERSPSTSDY